MALVSSTFLTQKVAVVVFFCNFANKTTHTTNYEKSIHHSLGTHRLPLQSRTIRLPGRPHRRHYTKRLAAGIPATTEERTHRASRSTLLPLQHLSVGRRDTTQRQLRRRLVALRTNSLLYRRTAPARIPPRRRRTHRQRRTRHQVHTGTSTVERPPRLVRHQQPLATSRLLACHESLLRRAQQPGIPQSSTAQKLQLHDEYRPHRRASAHPQPRRNALALRRNRLENPADKSRNSLQNRRIRIRCHRCRKRRIHLSARRHIQRNAKSTPAALRLYRQRRIPSHRNERRTQVGTRPHVARRRTQQRRIHTGTRHRHRTRNLRHHRLHMVARLFPHRHRRSRMGRPHRARHLQRRTRSRHSQLRRRTILLLRQPNHLHRQLRQQHLQARLHMDGIPPHTRNRMLCRQHAPHDAQLRLTTMDARRKRSHRRSHVRTQRNQFHRR